MLEILRDAESRLRLQGPPLASWAYLLAQGACAALEAGDLTSARRWAEAHEGLRNDLASELREQEHIYWGNRLLRGDFYTRQLRTKNQGVGDRPAAPGTTLSNDQLRALIPEPILKVRRTGEILGYDRDGDLINFKGGVVTSPPAIAESSEGLSQETTSAPKSTETMVEHLFIMVLRLISPNVLLHTVSWGDILLAVWEFPGSRTGTGRRMIVDSGQYPNQSRESTGHNRRLRGRVTGHETAHL